MFNYLVLLVCAMRGLWTCCLFACVCETGLFGLIDLGLLLVWVFVSCFKLVVFVLFSFGAGFGLCFACLDGFGDFVCRRFCLVVCWVDLLFVVIVW